jgi:predicted AAA+ superfamily ATPase
MYGNLFSLNQTHKKLKSEGLSVDKGTLSDFIKWCEDAYVLFPITIYTDSEHKARINPQKMYLADMGLAQACEVWNDSFRGKRFENLIFISLRSKSKYQKINYYLTNSKYEVDFICRDELGKLTLIQSCWELNKDSKEREIRALEEAMNELNLKKSFIVTFDQNEIIKVSSGDIYIIDMFKFFLDN